MLSCQPPTSHDVSFSTQRAMAGSEKGGAGGKRSTISLLHVQNTAAVTVPLQTYIETMSTVCLSLRAQNATPALRSLLGLPAELRDEIYRLSVAPY